MMEEKDATIVALGAQIAARAAENADKKDAKIAVTTGAASCK